MDLALASPEISDKVNEGAALHVFITAARRKAIPEVALLEQLVAERQARYRSGP